MSIGHAAFLFAASILAGAVNSVAGGGTLLSFPAAIAAGLPPIVANATNAVALVPGSLAAVFAYRRHLAGLGRLTALLCAPAVAGAIIGATILRHTPERLFEGVIPWLVLGATLLILLQSAFAGARGRRPGPAEAVPEPEATPATSATTATAATAATAAISASPPASPGKRRVLIVVAFQFLVSIYGGYFGAAMGIVMLAFLGHMPAEERQDRLDIHQMNAVKNVLAVVINGAASVAFVAHGLVRPLPALLMAAGAVTGGIVGGRLARRAAAHQVRRLVVGIGFAMAALLAWRRYG